MPTWYEMVVETAELLDEMIEHENELIDYIDELPEDDFAS